MVQLHGSVSFPFVYAFFFSSHYKLNLRLSSPIFFWSISRHFFPHEFRSLAYSGMAGWAERRVVGWAYLYRLFNRRHGTVKVQTANAVCIIYLTIIWSKVFLSRQLLESFSHLPDRSGQSNVISFYFFFLSGFWLQCAGRPSDEKRATVRKCVDIDSPTSSSILTNSRQMVLHLATKADKRVTNWCPLASRQIRTSPRDYYYPQTENEMKSRSWELRRKREINRLPKGRHLE